MRRYQGKYKKILLLSMLVSSVAFAENNSAVCSALKQGHAIFEVGGYQGLQGHAQHINIEGLIGDTFTLNNHQTNASLVGLGYFIEGKKLVHFDMSYGLNAFYLTPTSVSGNVIQENAFSNLSYRYRLENYSLYAMAKSTIHFNSTVGLTVDAGIGPNVIRAYGFQEQSLDGGITLPDNIFSSNTTTTFSATLGASIRFNSAFDQLPVEVGYRFFYLGQGHLNAANNQVLNTLTTGKTYANAIVLSISI